MNKMIVANLLHRPVRSAISIIAIAVEVTLILVIVGFSLGMLNDSKTRQAGIGADIMVQAPNASMLMGVSSAAMPIKVGDRLEKLPHVKVVSPVVMQLNTSGNVEVISGIDLKTYDELGAPFHYLEGGPFEGPDDILVDDVVSDTRHWHAGGKVTLFNHEFRVAGVVASGKGARIFLPLATMQDLVGAVSKASIFYITVDNADNTDTVVNEIHSIPGMEQYTVRSLKAYLSMLTPQSLPGLGKFIDVVVGVSMVIGFIVIFQAIYAAVMERTREIGILKSLGASKLYIVNAFLRETILLAVLGTIAGIVVSFVASDIIKAKLRLPVMIQPNWIGYAIIIAIVGALLGALYPAFKAAQKDPIDALAYE